MTGTEITTVVAASVVAVIGVVVGLVKLFGKNGKIPICPVNANDTLRLILEEVKEETRILRAIQDKLTGMGYEQNQAVLAIGRVETSLQAMHRRLDSVVDTR